MLSCLKPGSGKENPHFSIKKTSWTHFGYILPQNGLEMRFDSYTLNGQHRGSDCLGYKPRMWIGMKGEK
jgi:hypothetical protein